MLAQEGILGATQSAQVDDMFQSSHGRSARHILGCGAVGFNKPLRVGHHRMDQIKGRPAAFRRI